MKTLFIAVRAAFFASGFMFVAGWFALEFRKLDALLPWYLPRWTEPAALPLGSGGAALVVASLVTFVARGEGTPAPFDAPQYVVTAGPYRYIRNPMYIGGLAVLVAFGFYWRSPAVVIFGLLWFGLAHIAVVFLEEPDLRRKFGESYRAYCRDVPRWVPRRHGADQAKSASAVPT